MYVPDRIIKGRSTIRQLYLCNRLWAFWATSLHPLTRFPPLSPLELETHAQPSQNQKNAQHTSRIFPVFRRKSNDFVTYFRYMRGHHGWAGRNIRIVFSLASVARKKKRNVNLAKNHGLRVAFLKCTHVIFQNIALGKNVEEPTTDLCVESCALPPSPLPTSSIVGRSTEINPTS